MTLVSTNAQSTNASRSPRITNQNLRAMKINANAKPSLIALLRKFANATVSEGATFLSELSRVKGEKPKPCIPNGITCSECGCEITSVHQLGRASFEMATRMEHLTV